MGKKLTVGELRAFLRTIPPETEITFGSSKYRKRPLVFSRFRRRGDNLLQIELSEIDQSREPASEMDERKSAGYFLDQLQPWGDGAVITFGSSIDAVPLEFHSLSILVGVNLEQPREPRWRVEGD